jgi:hypothetical protein
MPKIVKYDPEEKWGESDAQMYRYLMKKYYRTHEKYRQNKQKIAKTLADSKKQTRLESKLQQQQQQQDIIVEQKQ